MKNINLYLVAFFAILIKTLILTMGWPEVAALSGLLIKLSFDAYLNKAKETKQSDNLDPLKVQLQETSNRLIQLENKVNMAKFNSK